MTVIGEGEPTSDRESSLSVEQLESIEALATLWDGSDIELPDYSKSTIIPDTFNGETVATKVAVEFFYRSGVIAKDEQPFVRQILLKKEELFKDLDSNQCAKYSNALKGTIFDIKFDVITRLVNDSHGRTYDARLGFIKGFISFIILDSMKTP
jgi:hypothetical protein